VYQDPGESNDIEKRMKEGISLFYPRGGCFFKLSPVARMFVMDLIDFQKSKFFCREGPK
jgi:hypothetical protein